MIAPKKLVTTANPPQSVVRLSDGHTFVAFERAAFGTTELKLSCSSGRSIEVYFGEKLSGENRIDRAPPGTVRYRSAELAVKPGTHTYRVVVPPDERNTGDRAILMPPYIGEVVPFRYVEICGHEGVIGPGDVRQLMVHYPFDDGAASFECDNDALNAVWDLCKYSIKATTFCGIYVDGDRERIPYEGDAYINQLGHYCLDTEYGMGRATLEHFMRHPTWPTEWLLHTPMMAWEEYMYSGDADFMRAHYEDLKLRLLLDLAREDGLISVIDGEVPERLVDALHLHQPPRDLVDWPPGSFTEGGTGERDGYDMVDVKTVINAFNYRALLCMQKIASVLGKDDESAFFSARARKVAESIGALFFDDRRGVYVDGEGSSHASLHANMFNLAFGLVPEERRNSVVDFIRSRGMACSVYGAQHLLDGLYSAGEAEYALSLMTAEHDRSWLNMLTEGSTITLEAWAWKYKNNLDWNHAWGAAPANIIPRCVAGIRPLEPGFRKVSITPQPGGLQEFRCTHPTPSGPIRVDYSSGKGGPRVTISVSQGADPVVSLEAWKGAKPEVVFFSE